MAPSKKDPYVNQPGQSLSGLSMVQMCLIRPPATSNAHTAMVVPST